MLLVKFVPKLVRWGISKFSANIASAKITKALKRLVQHDHDGREYGLQARLGIFFRKKHNDNCVFKASKFCPVCHLQNGVESSAMHTPITPTTLRGVSTAQADTKCDTQRLQALIVSFALLFLVHTDGRVCSLFNNCASHVRLECKAAQYCHAWLTQGPSVFP